VYLAENAKVDTLAHELFHEIDDAYGLIENGLLSKSVISDYNKLQNLAKGYGKSIKEMLYSRYPKAFEDNITDIKLKEAYRGISDVIHGMSNSDIFLGYGHKRAGYWDKEKALEKETFAQYGRTVFNGNEDAIKLFRELFPNSWKEISETMERMIK
jgi:predicted Zn-dependent protease with MMP-like domain